MSQVFEFKYFNIRVIFCSSSVGEVEERNHLGKNFVISNFTSIFFSRSDYVSLSRRLDASELGSHYNLQVYPTLYIHL